MARLSTSSFFGLVLSVVSGITAISSLGYMTAFLMNLKIPILVPTTVDGDLSSSPPSLPATTSLLWNVLLLLGFGVQHSGMLRAPVKSALRHILSEDGFRVLYVATTAAYLSCISYFWVPMPYLLWDLKDLLRLVVLAFSSLSLIGVLVSLLCLDPFIMLGIRPYFDQVFNREKAEPNFVTTGFYAMMRHPMYSFVMLVFWITPTMSIGHLLFAVVFTGYILFAVAQYEEPELVKTIGPRYEEYQRTTPSYIPTLSSLMAAMMGARTNSKAQ